MFLIIFFAYIQSRQLLLLHQIIKNSKFNTNYHRLLQIITDYYKRNMQYDQHLNLATNLISTDLHIYCLL